MTDSTMVKILNVDDNEPMRYARTRILRRAGYEVLEAATGTEALHLATVQPVDLVLLDVNLPGVNGFEICRRLKAHPDTASMLVLHVTATAFGAGSRVQGLESGADGYLVEPVEPHELVASVRALLRLRGAEEAARAVVRQWQTTFDAIGDGVCVLDAHGQVTRSNAAAARLLGKAPEEIVGRPFHDAVYGRPEPVDGSVFVRMQATRRRESNELRVGDRWFQVAADPMLDEADRLAGAVYTFSDVTGLKRGEARRSTQFAITRLLGGAATLEDAVPALLRTFCDGLEWDRAELWLVDPGSGRLRLAGGWPAAIGGPAGHSPVELAPGQGLAGRVWAGDQPVWIDDLQADGDLVAQPLTGGPALRTACAIPVRDAGRLGTLLLFSRSRREPDEALLQVAPAMGSQVGEFIGRKRGEELVARLNADLRARVDELQALLAERAGLLAQAEAARAEAEAANQAKDEFLATVSHELRTPLSAVLGWVHLLRSGSLDEVTRARALETLQRNARVQAQLINDLLDMSRIITGQLRLDLALLELEPVVRAALEAIRPSADAKGLRLEAVVEPAIGLVRGDADRIQQIAANLLSNAVKFTPDGGLIVVTLGRAGSQVELSVSDTGIGIAPEFLPHVFDRFRQADSSTTRAHGGLGIGLTIATQLAELHGGSIRAYSRGVGQGATFTLSLPLPGAMAALLVEPGGLARARAGEAPTPASSAASRPLTGLRVLVVDDEPDARDLVSATLQAAGAETLAAASVPDALAVLARSRPHVILADIGMPTADGYALVRQLRAWPKERGGAIPVVALTAYARDEDRARSLAAGFQSHLAKPVAAETLIGEILRLAARPA